jgi:hypothetical protein
MKLAQAKIADLWCRLMHTAPMWPSHGQYECRTCGRRHRVCWEAPAPFALRRVRLPCEAQDQRALLPVKDPACGTMALLTTAEHS